MNRLPRPAGVILLLLGASLLLASGVLGGMGARESPRRPAPELRSALPQGAAPHEAAQVECPPRPRAAVSRA